MRAKRVLKRAILVFLLILVAFPYVEYVVAFPPQQTPGDAPRNSAVRTAFGPSTTSSPLFSTGQYLKVGISSAAHYGDFELGYGFQYPIGFEHAAVAWWGEGFTFGYTVGDVPFYATSYESWPGVQNLTLITDALVRDSSDEVVYGSTQRTEDGKVELVHRFHSLKNAKFVILRVTIKNISKDTLSNVRYRRIWDFDMDNTVSGDGFDVDQSRFMLYAWETHYAALAASSLNPPTEWDIFAWDDIDTFLPGPNVYTGPFPAYGDYNVRLEWVYDTLAPGESKSIVMYHIGGDNKADLDTSYSQAEALRFGPFTCLQGSKYKPFGADTFFVDQVCPANEDYIYKGYGPLHPVSTGPLYIVIHCTDGKTIQDAIKTFQKGSTQKGSAQYIIDRDGKVVQMVSEQRPAGHIIPANVHTWEGQKIDPYNSIGIEHVGQCRNRGEGFQYPDVMYEMSARLVADIILRAKRSGRTIEPDRKYIVGHEEIQKQNIIVRVDPGPQWSWDRFMQLLEGSNDIAPITLLSAEIISQSKSEISITLRWRAKANGREGFGIWRRTEDSPYDVSKPTKKMSAPLRTEKKLQGDYEVAKELRDVIRLPRSGVRYCYSIWAYRFPSDLENGYYGGPITQERLRSREICTTPISLASAGVSSLSVSAITAVSENHRQALTFDIKGQGIHSISLQIFDLSGRRVFDSGEVQGDTLTWNLQNSAGQPLANGVYLYVVRVRGFNEEVYVSEVRKLVIVR